MVRFCLDCRDSVTILTALFLLLMLKNRFVPVTVMWRKFAACAAGRHSKLVF